MNTIRILLVDDQRLMRDGLRTLLEPEGDLQVVGEAENGREARRGIRVQRNWSSYCDS